MRRMIGKSIAMCTVATIAFAFSAALQGQGQRNNQATVDRLIRAIADHDMRKTHSIMAKGVHLNSRDSTGGTPLIESIDHNLSDLAKELVASGADPNFADNTGESPLMHAAWSCQVDLAQFLIEHGARREEG